MQYSITKKKLKLSDQKYH